MRARGLLAFLLLLVSSTSTAVAAPVVMVPLDGTYGPTFIVTLASEPGPANHLALDGSGSATTFGDSRITGDAVLHYADPTPCETFSGAPFTLKNTRGHALTFTAAGEQCYRLGTATTDAGRIFVSGRGRFTITGGTGPFAGATGGGALRFSGEVKDLLPGGYRGGYSPFVLDGSVSAPSPA